MAAQQQGNGQPCRLLDCPREIRDQIYAEILLDFPTPSLDCLAERSAYFQYSFSDPYIHKDYPWECLKVTHKIETKILLTNRQIFSEGKETILRRGRLMKVIASNVDLSWRLCGSQLCLIDARYSNLCMMTHHLHRDYRPGESPRRGLQFVLCGRDVETFCRAIMGDLFFIHRPPLSSRIRHTLTLTTNFQVKNVRPDLLARHTAHRQALQPFRKRLRGLSAVSLQGSCVGLSRVLAATALRDFRSKPIMDPDDILMEINKMMFLNMELCLGGTTGNSVKRLTSPLVKAINLCQLAKHSNVWTVAQRNATDHRAFMEQILSKAYQLVLLRLEAHVEFGTRPVRWAFNANPETTDIRLAMGPAVQTYEMCLAAAKWFGFPDWTPNRLWEMRMNTKVAEDLASYACLGETGVPLAIGYKAAQRALELAPGNKDFKVWMDWYNQWKRAAIQQGSFGEIVDVDGVLENNGMMWWSGSVPEQDYQVTLVTE